MSEAIDKESLESIINAVTAKEDVILSLEESKQRFQKKKQIAEFDDSALSFQEQRRLYKYLKKVSSPFALARLSLISGICFALGAVLVLWLLSIFLKQDTGVFFTNIITIFKSLF